MWTFFVVPIVPINGQYVLRYEKRPPVDTPAPVARGPCPEHGAPVRTISGGSGEGLRWLFEKVPTYIKFFFTPDFSGNIK